MSAPKVDVQVVFGEVASWLPFGTEDNRIRERFAEVRAAVAELIEVAQTSLYDMREVRDRCTSLVAVGLDEQVDESIDRLAAALANIGGAA